MIIKKYKKYFQCDPSSKIRMSKVEIKPASVFHNKLLDRHELVLNVSHPNASFTRESIKPYIQKNYNSDYFVVNSSKTSFGKTETTTKVRVYDTKEQFMKVEDFFVLFKMGLKKKDKDARRIRKDKRKKRMASWGTAKRQEKKAERKQK